MRDVDKIFNSLLGGGKPSPYTPVDYLESDGRGQYIDTGYTPNQDTRVVTTWMTKQAWNLPIMGAITSTPNDWYRLASYIGRFNFQYGNSSSHNTGVTVVKNLWTTLDIDRNVVNITINGVTSTYNVPTSDFTAPTTLALFGSKSAAQGIDTSPQLFQRTRIYDNGTLVLDLQPNIRNSDGVAGMLDTVNDVFHTNANPAGDNFLYGNLTEI